MILTRTPCRLSLLGGGTDYPDFSGQHGGLVFGLAINRYVYVTARRMPAFHDFRTRVAYSEVETVSANSAIAQPIVRATLAEMGMDDALEITHTSDLPGRSGVGSSSAFTVGLINALTALNGTFFSPDRLARTAIAVERRRLAETGGVQDQWFAASGGAKIFEFHPTGEVVAQPLLVGAARLRELCDHLLLFFTKVQRQSSEVASSYSATIGSRDELFSLKRLTESGIDAVRRGEYERLGRLVDQSWRLKCALSDRVTTPALSNLYARARLAGAFGGKLTGSGGGGCLLLVAPLERHKKIVESLTDVVHIPFRLAPEGSAVIFAGECP